MQPASSRPLAGPQAPYAGKAPAQPAAAPPNETHVSKEDPSTPSSPLLPSLQAQQLSHTVQKSISTYSTAVPEALYKHLAKFILDAETVPDQYRVYCHNALKTMQQFYNNPNKIPLVKPEIYLQCIEPLSLFFQLVCQTLSENHQLSRLKLDVTGPVPVLSAADFAPVYKEKIHPAFKIFQRYVNLFFDDLKKRGLLADHTVKVADPSKKERLRFCVDSNGYVPITHKPEGTLSAVYVRYGEDVVQKPAQCNQKVLIYWGEEFESRSGFLIELKKKSAFPGLPAIPTVSISGRYGLHENAPFFCYDIALVKDLQSEDASTNLIKWLYAKEIADWSKQLEDRLLFLPLPDLTVEGPEFAYLYLEELVCAESPEAKEVIREIETIEEKPVQKIMEELKEEILQTLEIEESPPAVPKYPKKQIHSKKKPEKPVEEENKAKSAQQAEEEERKANRARRLQQKFEQVMDKKRIKLRQATKLFNAVFKNNPELKVTRETARGSHVSVSTPEGAATTVRPHGGKDISVGKRPVMSFIDKIAKAAPGFIGKK